MTMLTITEFLLARIAEDEVVARAAIADDGGADEGFANQYDRLVGTYGHPLDFVPRFGEAAARLITRFAVPARVLAECKATRHIVEYHGPGLGGDVCDEWEIWPCPTIRLLALPYADHPDFLDVWRRLR